MMFSVGLYLAGWFPKFALVEKVGLPLWRKLEPLGKSLLPVRSAWHALLLGVVWGWLPCGLVYAAAVYSVSAGGGLQGALIMLMFGIGTLPAMVTVGMLSNRMIRLAQLPRVRRGAGLVIILLALLTLLFGGNSAEHVSHMHASHMH
jgi:sulfite exporter TauE/SafE